MHRYTEIKALASLSGLKLSSRGRLGPRQIKAAFTRSRLRPGPNNRSVSWLI